MGSQELRVKSNKKADEIYSDRTIELGLVTDHHLFNNIKVNKMKNPLRDAGIGIFLFVYFLLVA